MIPFIRSSLPLLASTPIPGRGGLVFARLALGNAIVLIDTGLYSIHYDVKPGAEKLNRRVKEFREVIG
ncbi:MAG: hypothetical protein LBS49_13385 [Candidatus Accumulibacter sp.]|jgi:hypothetical protein|nr:hypothetical protein [Accumulibacter sp.]